jgi:hypothetical protein
MNEYDDPFDAVREAFNNHDARFEVVLRGRITGAEITGRYVTEVTIAGQSVRLYDGPIHNGYGELSYLESYDVKIRKVEP